MDLVACKPISTWPCNMHLHTSPISSPGEGRRQEFGLLQGTWQDKLKGQGIWYGVGKGGSAVPCVLL